MPEPPPSTTGSPVSPKVVSDGAGCGAADTVGNTLEEAPGDGEASAYAGAVERGDGRGLAALPTPRALSTAWVPDACVTAPACLVEVAARSAV